MAAYSSVRMFFSLELALLVGIAEAKRSCPKPVASAVESAYPGARISRCKEETEDGKTQYEVKLAGKAFRGLEIDLTPGGAILLTEKKMKVRSLPKEVRSAFKAKYPTMNIAGARVQTRADGSVSYELGFQDKMENQEATFSGEGVFLEEE